MLKISKFNEIGPIPRDITEASFLISHLRIKEETHSYSAVHLLADVCLIHNYRCNHTFENYTKV